MGDRPGNGWRKGVRLRQGVADRLLWTKPRDPLSFICSSCGNAIDERETPLRLMGARYAVFCEACVVSCFEVMWIEPPKSFWRRTR
jgi:hypothetical protein